jgi:hypothetical protein
VAAKYFKTTTVAILFDNQSPPFHEVALDGWVVSLAGSAVDDFHFNPTAIVQSCSSSITSNK